MALAQGIPNNLLQYNNLKFCLNADTLSSDLLAGSWQKAPDIYMEHKVVLFNHSVLLKISFHVLSVLVQFWNVLLRGIEFVPLQVKYTFKLA